ncbi:hypothetical protein ARMGADRAFT_1083176 [Armillaria gallica]|uniref:Uncharacterized protein n=1 Tax=Armillaria gallica TaxID=47427 RepID=A0A2H3DKY2_ARMGA|nr:hypothetical protein ARMGADRAFT_1083176 [Armillaria gallica]
MAIIVFPPKPPALSELVARLEHLVSLNLPKSSLAQAVKDWFHESKDIETLISIHYADFRGNHQLKWLSTHTKHFLRLHVSFTSPCLAAVSKAVQAVIEWIEEMPPVASAFDSDINMGSSAEGNGSSGWGKSSWSNAASQPSSGEDHASGTQTLDGGVPDRNVLSFPFVGESDKAIDSVMAKIDSMTLSTALYGPIRASVSMSKSLRAQEVKDSAHAYASLNWRQLTFDGPETLASLVASCDSLFSRIEVNTCELFALLKVRATLMSEYCIIQAKLEEKR